MSSGKPRRASVIYKENNTKNSRHLAELTGLLFIFMSLLIGLSLWTFDVADPTLNHSISAPIEIKNAVGKFGAHLSGILVEYFGFLSYFFVFFFFFAGLAFIKPRLRPSIFPFLGYIILLPCFIIVAEYLTISIGDVQGGGKIGALLFELLQDTLNSAGTLITLLFAFIIGIQFITHFTFINSLASFFSFSQKTVQKQSKNMASNLAKKLPLSKGKKALAGAEIAIDVEVKDSRIINKADTNPADLRDATKDSLNGKSSKKEKIQELKTTEKDTLNTSTKNLFIKNEEEKPLSSNNKERKNKKEASSLNNEKEDTKKSFWRSVFFSDDVEEEEEELKEIVSNLPPIDLLSPIPEQNNMPTRESLEAKGESLIQCLLDFSVQGTLAGILPGPVVTMFEVRPERGVKAKRFEVLAKEIAMSIKAIAVRVQAPIPGTDTVGIEIPNDTRQVVSFREIIQSDAFTKSDSVLSLGLGKDIFGKPVCGKMEEMPHLLVAGATGAGKSVCLNSIILSILYKARPHEVKMLLIDPKRVELAMYADLPHLVHPVVTDMDLAKNALLWAIDEMDQRYQLFQNTRVRNFTEYNSFVKKQQKKYQDDDFEDDEREDSVERELRINSINDDTFINEKGERENLPKPLPYIVIIVDELADLMMQKGKDVEASIVRLAQLARAAGIHLIIATQRPSVDVVTGLIKANFPSRIAFQVTSGIDSRTILDTVGAEALLGKGDMLFKPRAGAIQRMHGAFVTDEEVTQVVDFWKKDRKVEYSVDFTQYGAQATESAFGDKDNAYDPMFDTILARIIEMDEVSISMLQRHFKLGFGRAGRIMDQLERDGIVGPASGSKPRKVIR